jgi:ribosome production factor 2
MAAPPPTATKVSKKVIKRQKERESKVIENPKKCMFIKGPKSSQVLNGLLHDLVSDSSISNQLIPSGIKVPFLISKTPHLQCLLKKPYGIKYQRKNQIRPFDDDASLEFFAQKCDASQFIVTSHTKKVRFPKP